MNKQVSLDPCLYEVFLGGIIAILGIGLFAIPAGIIASGFLEYFEKNSKR